MPPIDTVFALLFLLCPEMRYKEAPLKNIWINQHMWKFLCLSQQANKNIIYLYSEVAFSSYIITVVIYLYDNNTHIKQLKQTY